MAHASRWFQRILRWGLGALLIFAAWGKLSSPFGFAVAVTGYGVVGQELALWIAAVLPVSLCGELAGRVDSISRLLKTGIRSLSVSATLVPDVKHAIRNASA